MVSISTHCGQTIYPYYIRWRSASKPAPIRLVFRPHLFPSLAFPLSSPFFLLTETLHIQTDRDWLEYVFGFYTVFLSLSSTQKDDCVIKSTVVMSLGVRMVCYSD